VRSREIKPLNLCSLKPAASGARFKLPAARKVRVSVPGDLVNVALRIWPGYRRHRETVASHLHEFRLWPFFTSDGLTVVP
jgi:hypothetical protein